jgi:hypothetical protein
MNLFLYILYIASVISSPEASYSIQQSENNKVYSIILMPISRDGPVTPLPTAIPTPTPIPTPTVQVFSCQTRGGDWAWVIVQYDWSWWEACQVIICESEGLQYAVSPTGCISLFQICPNGSFDPETNAAQAYGKYLDGVRVGNRWYHWNQHGNCGHFY